MKALQLRTGRAERNWRLAAHPAGTTGTKNCAQASIPPPAPQHRINIHQSCKHAPVRLLLISDGAQVVNPSGLRRVRMQPDQALAQAHHLNSSLLTCTKQLIPSSIAGQQASAMHRVVHNAHRWDWRRPHRQLRAACEQGVHKIGCIKCSLRRIRRGGSYGIFRCCDRGPRGVNANKRA